MDRDRGRDDGDGGVELGYKHRWRVDLRFRRIYRAWGYRKVSGRCLTYNIDVARSVKSDAISRIHAFAGFVRHPGPAKIGRVDQRFAGWVQFGHERVILPISAGIILGLNAFGVVG